MTNVQLSAPLGAPLRVFLARLGAPAGRCVAAGGTILRFPTSDCVLHILFVADQAVAVHGPYPSRQPHVDEVHAAAAPFQPANCTPQQEPGTAPPTKLYLDDHGWTLALVTCSPAQVEAVATAA